MALSLLEIAELRDEFGKGELEAKVLGAQLLQIVEQLQVELAAAETRAASAHLKLEALVAALEQRLYRAPDAAPAGCALCREFLALLRRMVISPGEGDDAVHQG